MAFTRTQRRHSVKLRATADTESPKPEARGLESAYTAALRALSRRELSERQIRDRLTRRGHAAEDIDDAVTRLTGSGALNDARVAAAIARSETGLKKRGRTRVRLQLQRAGIGSELAKQAVDDTFSDIDDDALLEAALAKRLKDDQPIADDRMFQRLYRYLVGQGFESDRALKALSARRRRRLAASEPEDRDDI